MREPDNVRRTDDVREEPGVVREPGYREPGYMGPTPAGWAYPWTRWQNWANVLFGFLLFISPWIYNLQVNLPLTPYAHAAWNAWIVGVSVALIAMWSLDAPHSSIPEWINVLLGAWLFISPWVLGFTALTAAAWTAWILGVLIVIAAAWAIVDVQRLRRNPVQPAAM